MYARFLLNTLAANCTLWATKKSHRKLTDGFFEKIDLL